MAQRNLTEAEIALLEKQNCRAENWKQIFFAEPFDAPRFRNAHFSGEIQIGRQTGAVGLAGGAVRPCGIYDSSVHNCSFGNDTFVSNVGMLANYDVEDGVVVDNVRSLVVHGESAFGNGTQVEVQNEGGGREIPIYDRLTAQIAYLMVHYRHRPKALKNIEAMVEAYVNGKKSSRGRLQTQSRVQSCGDLRNVAIGPHAQVVGAVRLNEGTIASCVEAPSKVGYGVIADKFIILSGSSVTDGALLSAVFVGQGVRLGKQYSAENSIFFANCEGFHGEAVAVFAGPYAVTHHKSTLLIAGMFSFYNAGSGSNQSNHMYKLGPVHQGILDRGSKTASFSYVMWPSRVGAFSVLVGKHASRFDAANLPFSYITEEGGRSCATPGMNLFTVGTRRDCEKWPTRDRRKAPEKLDLINFDLFSPYIVGRMLQGSKDLEALAAAASPKQEDILYKGILIKRLLLRRACKNYEIGIKIAIGDCLAARLEAIAAENLFAEIKISLAQAASSGETGPWTDLSGLLAPQKRIDGLLADIEAGRCGDLDQTCAALHDIDCEYGQDKWEWFAALLEKRLGKPLGGVTAEDLAGVIRDWQENRVKLNNMIEQDALKEFNDTAQIGYGIDGGDAEKQADFEAVRGRADTNKFILSLKTDSQEVEQRAAILLQRLGAGKGN